MLHAISNDRLRDFETLGAAGVERWLRIAIEQYFCGNHDSWAFEPFGLVIGTTDSIASDIEAIYRAFSPKGKENFRIALVSVLQDLLPDPEKASIWQFIMELTWLLPAPEAIKVLEWRFTEDFFDCLCRKDSKLFDNIFLFVIDTAVTGAEAERCISRLVASRRLNSCYSRHALLRLCEIAPDNWINHFSITRDKLHELFCYLRPDETEQVQDELAQDIISVIGFERFCEGMRDLLVIRDSDWLPQDTWLWAALVERTKSVIVVESGAKWYIAPAHRPSYWRQIPSQIIHGPHIAHEIETTKAEDGDQMDNIPMRHIVDRCLGAYERIPAE